LGTLLELVREAQEYARGGYIQHVQCEIRTGESASNSVRTRRVGATINAANNSAISTSNALRTDRTGSARTTVRFKIPGVVGPRQGCGTVAIALTLHRHETERYQSQQAQRELIQLVHVYPCKKTNRCRIEWIQRRRRFSQYRWPDLSGMLASVSLCDVGLKQKVQLKPDLHLPFLPNWE
jgi:hypothetical protein